MKNLMIILSLFVTNTLMSNELSWVDEQIQAIKPPREGMESHDILSIKDPFIFLSKIKSKKSKIVKNSITPSPITQAIVKTKILKKTLSLSMILNKVAMINGDWYKVGDLVNGYRVTKIDRISVILNNQNRKLILSTKSMSNKLKFQK